MAFGLWTTRFQSQRAPPADLKRRAETEPYLDPSRALLLVRFSGLRSGSQTGGRRFLRRVDTTQLLETGPWGGLVSLPTVSQIPLPSSCRSRRQACSQFPALLAENFLGCFPTLSASGRSQAQPGVEVGIRGLGSGTGTGNVRSIKGCASEPRLVGSSWRSLPSARVPRVSFYAGDSLLRLTEQRRKSIVFLVVVSSVAVGGAARIAIGTECVSRPPTQEPLLSGADCMPALSMSRDRSNTIASISDSSESMARR